MTVEANPCRHHDRMQEPVIKTCERCSQTFLCEGYQCWCGTVGITEAHMAWIEVRFKDCLCPACLHVIKREQGDGHCSTPERV